MTYLITFACYGWHLHGDGTGSVDAAHNVYGTPILEEDAARAAFEEAIREVWASWLGSAGGPRAKQSRAYGGGCGSSAGARHERLQSIRQPPFESDEAG